VVLRDRRCAAAALCAGGIRSASCYPGEILDIRRAELRRLLISKIDRLSSDAPAGQGRTGRRSY